MGITSNCTRFLAYAKSRDVSYERTIMLGRQILYVTPEEIREQFRHFNILPKTDDYNSEFAEILFRSLGADVVDSLDYSDFEKASIITDLNIPVPDRLKEQYTVVFDGGTLEHVFNFPQAIKNCMDMLKIGGHFIGITPTNNQCGHGFYQFSPELFFTLFSQEHGFETMLIAIGVDFPETGITDWYAVREPKKIKKRVTLTNSRPTYLMILAKKIGSTDALNLKPMQSDYQNIWEIHDSMKNNIPRESESSMVYVYRKYFPEVLKRVVRKFVNTPLDKQEVIKELGTVNPAFFEKIDI